MPRQIYEYPYHVRKGKFGKTEQHSERKFKDYLADLQIYAEGFMTPITRFTKRKSGLVDTDMIKDTVRLMTEDFEDLPDNAEKREFYSSFLYCALALMSVEFDYFPNHRWHRYELPPSRFPDDINSIPELNIYHDPPAMNFLTLVEEANLIQQNKGDRPDLFSRPVHHPQTDEEGTEQPEALTDTCEDYEFPIGFEDDNLFGNFLPELYMLLTGEDTDLPIIAINPWAHMSKQQVDEEIQEQDEYYKNNPMPEWSAKMENADVPDDDDDDDDFEKPVIMIQQEELKPEEAEEAILSFRKRVTAIYPGYADFVQNFDLFLDYYDTYASEDFSRMIRDMVSSFLLSQGCSLYSSEDVYIEVMVSVNRARKKIMEAMRYGR